MVPPVDIRKVVGSTVHAKSIHVMAKAECNRLYGSHNKVKMVEGVVINVNLQITKQRRKQFYVIADYKNPGGSVKRARLNIKSVVSGSVIFPGNLPATVPILAATTTTIVPANPSTIFPDDHSTPVDPAPVPTTTTTTLVPALLPTTTTVLSNRPTIVAPAPEPTITDNVHSNTHTHVVLEPDKTTTTRVYANLHNENAPVPDPTPPPQNPPVPDQTPPPQISPVPDPTPPPQINLYLIRICLLKIPLDLIQLHLPPVLPRLILIVME